MQRINICIATSRGRRIMAYLVMKKAVDFFAPYKEMHNKNASVFLQTRIYDRRM